jgi:hypothetical protein
MKKNILIIGLLFLLFINLSIINAEDIEKEKSGFTFVNLYSMFISLLILFGFYILMKYCYSKFTNRKSKKNKRKEIGIIEKISNSFEIAICELNKFNFFLLFFLITIYSLDNGYISSNLALSSFFLLLLFLLLYVISDLLNRIYKITNKIKRTKKRSDCLFPSLWLLFFLNLLSFFIYSFYLLIKVTIIYLFSI